MSTSEAKINKSGPEVIAAHIFNVVRTISIGVGTVVGSFYIGFRLGELELWLMPGVTNPDYVLPITLGIFVGLGFLYWAILVYPGMVFDGQYGGMPRYEKSKEGGGGWSRGITPREERYRAFQNSFGTHYVLLWVLLCSLIISLFVASFRWYWLLDRLTN